MVLVFLAFGSATSVSGMVFVFAVALCDGCMWMDGWVGSADNGLYTRRVVIHSEFCRSGLHCTARLALLH